MKVKELIALLESDGWTLVGQRQHRQFHATFEAGDRHVAGKPSVDVPPGTLNESLKQAGLKKAE